MRLCLKMSSMNSALTADTGARDMTLGATPLNNPRTPSSATTVRRPCIRLWYRVCGGLEGTAVLATGVVPAPADRDGDAPANDVSGTIPEMVTCCVCRRVLTGICEKCQFWLKSPQVDATHLDLPDSIPA